MQVDAAVMFLGRCLSNICSELRFRFSFSENLICSQYGLPRESLSLTLCIVLHFLGISFKILRNSSKEKEESMKEKRNLGNREFSSDNGQGQREDAAVTWHERGADSLTGFHNNQISKESVKWIT